MEEMEMASNEITSNEMSLIEMTSMESRQLHSSQKEAMKKIMEFSGESVEFDIDEWLFDLTNLFSVMKSKDETLKFVIFNYNTAMHATTNQTPFEMMHGRIATLPFDQQETLISFTQEPEHGQKIKDYPGKLAHEALISFTQEPEHGEKIKDYRGKLAQEARKNILKSQCQYKIRYDLNRQELTLKINDLVLVKTRNLRNKFDIRYEGPFKIIKQLGSKTFIVQHVKELTLTRQMTMDVIVPLVERWNLIK